MLIADAEINRLRFYLSDKQWLSHEIDSICNLAWNDINEVILDIVSNAVADATEHAESIGADEFIEEIDVVETGNSYEIRTLSGRTDYSTERQKMLPHLIKNGKTAQDGSKYKIIPVKGEEQPRMPADTFSAMRARASAVEQVRESLQKYNEELRSAKAGKMAGKFRDIMREKIQKRSTISTQTESSEVKFRTASSKQDVNSDWVIPEKDIDMTEYLYDLNTRIEQSISSSVQLIIESYEREYGDV